MWTLTVKGLLAHKLRLAATGLAVVLGVAFMSGTMVVTDTIGRTFDDLFATVYDNTDAHVRSAESVEVGFGMTDRERIEAGVLDTVLAVEGVAHAEGLVEGYTQIVGADGEPVGDPGMGAPTFGINWPERGELNPFDLAEGRAPERAGEVAIDRGSARRGDLAVGDTTTAVTQAGVVPVTIVGIVTFGGADSPGGASFTAFTHDEAQRLLAEPGRYSYIDVIAEPGVSEEELRRRLVAALPGDLEVLTGSEIIAEEQDVMREGMAFFNTFLLTFALIALFVGAFIIHNTFSIIVAQRTREMALLRAVGASRRQVLLSVLGEALAMALGASAVGVAAGVAVAAGLRALLAGFGIDLPEGGIVLSAGTVAAAMTAGVAVTMVSAVLPARRASRVPPIAAMREVAVDTSSRSRLRIVVGLLVLAAGVLLLAAGLAAPDAATVGGGAAVTFIGVAALGPVIAGPVSRVIGAPLPRLRGITGALARENALRNPKRTAATASALMIGVGLVSFITIFGESAKASIDRILRDAFVGDLVIDSGSFGFGGLPTELAPRVEAVEGVAAAVSLRGGPVELAGETTFLAAADPVRLEQVMDLEVTAGDLSALADDGIAVSRQVADGEGWAVGDVVPARFARTGSQELRVAAIYERREAAGDRFISLAAHERHFEDRFDMVVMVAFEPGADRDAVRRAVEAVAADYPTATVQDLGQYVEAQAAQLDAILGLVTVLLALAVLIALLGITNTLALSVFERTRELGLLRAVGMTREQLRALVRWESLLIALLGTAMGLAVGLFFGWGLVRSLAGEGFTELVVPAGSLLVIVVVAAVAGVLAAVPPARRAARLDVLRAVTVE